MLNILLFLYVNARLFTYIKTLESTIQSNITKTENLFQSIKEIVHDDYLLNDGRLKKFRFQKENNKIFNGINVIDQAVEF